MGLTVNGIPEYTRKKGALVINGVDQRARRVFHYDPASQNLGLLYGGGPGSNTRATTRTVVKDGVVETVAATAPAFGDSGLSVEPAATNLLTYSEQFDNAAWSKGGSTIVTANQGVAPDGNTTADRLQMPAGSGTYLDHAFSATSGVTYTFSVWIKENGSGSSLDIGFSTVSGGGANIVSSGALSVAAGWTRHSISWTSDTTGSRWVVIDNVGGAASCDVLVWGAQLEVGTVPTAYIPTTTSTVSRAADANGFTLPQALKDILSTAEGPATAQGTLVVKGWVPGLAEASIATDLGIVAAADAAANLLFFDQSAGVFGAYDGTNTAAGGAVTVASGNSYDLAVRWSSTTNLMQVGYKLSSASTWTWGTAAAFDGAFQLGASLNIGYSPSYPFEVGSVTFYDRWMAEGEL